MRQYHEHTLKSQNVVVKKGDNEKVQCETTPNTTTTTTTREEEECLKLRGQVEANRNRLRCAVVESDSHLDMFLYQSAKDKSVSLMALAVANGA